LGGGKEGARRDFSEIKRNARRGVKGPFPEGKKQKTHRNNPRGGRLEFYGTEREKSGGPKYSIKFYGGRDQTSQFFQVECWGGKPDFGGDG